MLILDAVGQESIYLLIGGQEIICVSEIRPSVQEMLAHLKIYHMLGMRQFVFVFVCVFCFFLSLVDARTTEI